MKKFKVADRVVWVYRSSLEKWNVYEDDTTRGVVESINSDGKFTVKWDKSWVTPNPSQHNADELITEAAADKIRSKLVKEFEAWAGPIRNKIEQAAKCLAEAGELAAKQNKDLTEMYELTGALIGAMDDVGWRTSSLSC
jgi:DNA repair exonuclease SbcCD nuclease subunit